MSSASGAFDSRWELLRGLPDDERRELLASGRRRRFARREVLFHAGDTGDTIHLIVSGLVAVYVTTPLGNTAILGLLSPGEAVGELALLTGNTERTATAIALEPTETLSIRRDVFLRARERHRDVDRILIEVLAERVRVLNQQLVDAYFEPAEKRLARCLVALRDDTAGADGGQVVRLTQEQVAGLAGISRATANRVLREFEEAGVLGLARGRITIADPKRLAALAR